MRTLWLAGIYGIPILVVFHWGADIVSHRVRDTTTRLLAAQHAAFLLILWSTFAMQVLPIKYAGWITVLGIETPGILLVTLSIHLYFRILGWPRRWPKSVSLILAYAWSIPWMLFAFHHALHALSFYHQGLWIKPYYGAPFHAAMDISAFVAGILVVNMGVRLYKTQDADQRGKIGGLFGGAVFTVLSHILLGSLLPARTPAWLPPDPYVIGILGWIAVLRYTVTRYEFLPSRLQRYRAFFKLSAVPIVMADLNGAIVDLNPAAKSLLGTARRTLQDVVTADDRETTWQAYHNAFTRKNPLENWTLNVIAGDSLPRSVSVDADFVQVGNRTYGILIMRDTTEEKREQARLTRLAYHDGLTGLPNAVQFQRHVEAALQKGALDHARFALLMVDLDNFKVLNDTWGHQSGNAALVTISQRLSQHRRADDLVSRIGGDEFALFLADVPDASIAQDLARRVVDSFKELIAVGDGHSFEATASVGISLYPEHGLDAAALIEAADAAMYAAKRSGKNRFALYNPALRSPQSGTGL